MSKPLSFALIIIALIIGMGLGFTITPEYTTMANDSKSTMELGKPDKYLDQRFLEGMIAHHQTAIDLAKQTLEKSHRQETRDLAQDIIKVDEASIKELYSQRKNWYGNDSLINDFTKINLGENDGKFELRLINALIAHHDEAISVAQEVRTKSTRTEVLNIADSTITNLTSSKALLLKWRQDWYQF